MRPDERYSLITSCVDAAYPSVRWRTIQPLLIEAFAGAQTGQTSSRKTVLIDLAKHLKEPTMSLTTILLIVLLLMLFGAMPTWPHSRGWGYAPSSGLGLILLILVVLMVLGRI